MPPYRHFGAPFLRPAGGGGGGGNSPPCPPGHLATDQQPISTAAEPSKQSEVLMDACEHPVDKGNVITDKFGR